MMEFEKIKGAVLSPKSLFSSDIPAEDIPKLYKLSFVYSAFAIFNWRLGSAVVLNRNFRFFLFDFMLYLSVFVCFLIFYIPVVHLFLGNLDSSSKRIITYFNFSTTIWIITLPLSLLSAPLGHPISFFLFLILSLISVFYIYFMFVSGISSYYQKTKLKSFFLFVLPLILFSVLFLINLALIAGMIFSI